MKKCILVIDDTGIFLRTVKSLLEPTYEVLLAKSGEKGLNTAINNPVDLILLDYEMPEWDGKETLNRIRECDATANIPVIFLTGVNNKTHVLDILKLHPQGYVLKPVDEEELLKKIEEVFKQ